MVSLARRITFAIAGTVTVAVSSAAVAIHAVIRHDFEPFAGHFAMMQSMMGSAPSVLTRKLLDN